MLPDYVTITNPLVTADGLPVIAEVPRLCRNCRFWEKADKDDTLFVNNSNLKLGRCGNPAFVDGYNDESEVKNDGVLLYTDGTFPFLSMPDFGCIHFEVKDESLD